MVCEILILFVGTETCRYSLGSLSAKKLIRGLTLSGGFPSFHNSSGAFLLLCHLPPFPFLPELELPSPFLAEEWGSVSWAGR